MIVIKSIEKLAATVRQVAREQNSYRPGIVSDLNEAAAILENLAAKGKHAEADTSGADNILEDIP
jgi:hypothetical protein